MLLKRFYHDGLAQASYLVGCQATGDALVIDANRDVDQYLEAATREGLRITAVTETHIHADYVSGSRELAARSGARLYLSAEGAPEWQYAFARDAGATLVRGGDTFKVGNLLVAVLHTPGHTPEHISFMLTDTAASDRPIGLFSGDFVFVGDVGRPDLLERAAGYTDTMEAGARDLYRSLVRFETLPDYLQVWPAHGAGSACGKALGAVPSTTVGYEKLVNWAFKTRDEDDFVTQVLDGQPDPPAYFAQMKRINKVGPARRPTVLPPRGDLAALRASLAAGTPVVDTRQASDFAASHAPGSVNIPAGGSFLGWAGWLLPYDRPFTLIADETALPMLLKELSLIGLDAVAMWWPPDVLDVWQREVGDLASFHRLASREAGQLLTRNGATILDVRTVEEYGRGHIPHSINIPLGRLPRCLAEVPVDKPVYVTCESGSRSPIAASLLAAAGHAPIIEMFDGYNGWAGAGLPVEK